MSNIPLYQYIHSSVNRHLSCFHVLAIVNRAAVNTGVHVSFQIIVCSGYMPRSGIAGSHDKSTFSFLRTLHIVPHGGWTNLHSHRQLGGFPFIHILSSIYHFLDSLVTIIVTCLRWSHCCFDLHFSNNWQCWARTFSCACWPDVCLLWRNI